MTRGRLAFAFVVALPGVGLACLPACNVLLSLEDRVERVCEGGAVRCDGELRLECAADGSEEVESPCPGVALCVGEGTCMDVECVEANGTVEPDPTPGDCMGRTCVDHALVDGIDDTDAPLDACARCSGGAPIPLVTSLAQGVAVNHTCALLCDGRVACWGSNQWGQLGSPLSVDGSDVPRFVPLDGPARLLTTGFGHTCVELEDGRVYCFGLNDHGQVKPNAAAGGAVATPFLIPELAGAKALGAGDWSTCAVLSDRTVCFGLNDAAQLGDGASGARVGLTTVLDAAGVSAPAKLVAVGARSGCSVHEDGALVCWGNTNQTGLGITTEQLLPPMKVATTDPVATLSVGDLHTCFATETGKAFCFGGNGSGQTGPSTFPSNAFAPVEITASASTTRVSAGFRHSCALGAGVLQCWGDDGGGQLGDAACQGDPDGCPGEASLDPVVAQLSGATDVSTPWLHTCAVADGRVYCWGTNDVGQLGLGIPDFSVDVPTPVVWPPVSG